MVYHAFSAQHSCMARAFSGVSFVYQSCHLLCLSFQVLYVVLCQGILSLWIMFTVNIWESPLQWVALSRAWCLLTHFFVSPALADSLTSSVFVSVSYTFMFSLLHRCLMNSIEHFLLDFKEPLYAQDIPHIFQLCLILCLCLSTIPVSLGPWSSVDLKSPLKFIKICCCCFQTLMGMSILFRRMCHMNETMKFLFKAIPWLVVSISCCPSAWRLLSSWTISRLVLLFNPRISLDPSII